MNNLQSIWETEIVPNKKLSKESPYVLEAIHRIQNRNRFKIENHEKVIELPDLILECLNISIDYDKKRGNCNAG